MKFSSHGTFYKDYMSPKQTVSIRGIFAVIIVFSHMSQYVEFHGGFLDSCYNMVGNRLGQLIVTVFFFYSGYGIWQGYSKKKDYVSNFLKNRVLRTLIHFDIAVFLFLIVDLLLGIKYDTPNYILCWIGWLAIGNSKWFIFDILSMWIVTYFVFMIVEKNKSAAEKKALLSSLLWGGILLLVGILYILKHKDGSWWYDTLLVYPFGVTYSYMKESIEKYVMTKRWKLFLLCSIILFMMFYLIDSVFTYNIAACFFVLTITLITMKVKIENQVLIWLGNISFSIYIIQRIPMIVLKNLKLDRQPYIFAMVVIPTVLLCGYVFDTLLKQVDFVFDKKVLKVPSNGIRQSKNKTQPPQK